MDERRPIIIFSDQKEEQLSHDMSLLCSRMQKGQLLKASALALYPIYNHLNIYKKTVDFKRVVGVCFDPFRACFVW